MNTCHSSNSKQENIKTCLKSDLNNPKTIFKAIALALEAVLSHFWDIAPSSSEPRVWQERDQSGQLYWRVYDPTHDRSISFYSEQEIRRWLEKRYYQNNMNQ